MLVAIFESSYSFLCLFFTEPAHLLQAAVRGNGNNYTKFKLRYNLFHSTIKTLFPLVVKIIVYVVVAG